MECVATGCAARNHVLGGRWLRCITVPAVTGAWRPHPAHSCRRRPPSAASLSRSRRPGTRSRRPSAAPQGARRRRRRPGSAPRTPGGTWAGRVCIAMPWGEHKANGTDRQPPPDTKCGHALVKGISLNDEYIKRNGNPVSTTGTATSATYRLGLFRRVEGNWTLSHGFYSGLASNTANPVPTQTVTFHSLEANTVYIVAVVVDDLEGETDTERFGRDLARTCIRTAA